MTSSSFDPVFSHVYPDAALRRAYDRDPAGHWYVLRTKPRQESRAEQNLKAWGLQTLLPLCPDRPGRAHRRDRDSVMQVLFPSYIFCRFHEDMFGKVKFTYGVSNVVSFGGVPAVVDQTIIDELATRLDPAGFVSLQDRPLLNKGDKVVIESGPFKNFMAVFDQEITGSDRVRILLDAVKFQSRMEIPRSEIRKLPLHGAADEPLTTETRRGAE
jgi:transcriptional antiterminator RfaH